MEIWRFLWAKTTSESASRYMAFWRYFGGQNSLLNGLYIMKDIGSQSRAEYPSWYQMSHCCIGNLEQCHFWLTSPIESVTKHLFWRQFCPFDVERKAVDQLKGRPFEMKLTTRPHGYRVNDLKGRVWCFSASLVLPAILLFKVLFDFPHHWCKKVTIFSWLSVQFQACSYE